MRAACGSAKELSENWQYRAQLGGADQLVGDLTPLTNARYFSSNLDIPNILARYKGDTEIFANGHYRLELS
jgi:hypothetical protein